ncbi:MAG: molybdopterin cofactor-binding domain-containing protein, partial [Limisphaerales bacterium]
MPSWPEKRDVIGSKTLRVDGPAKVTGRALYASDVQPDGWLYGMILRSKWPKARVVKINLEPALKMPGIKAAVLRSEGERTVRYYGEELAAVAGTSKQACLDALRVIQVDAKPLPFVVRENDAKEEGAPRVWEDAPNLSKPHVNEQGEVDKAFGECAAVVEGFFTTPVQLHHPLETHGNTVSYTDEEVT